MERFRLIFRELSAESGMVRRSDNKPTTPFQSNHFSQNRFTAHMVVLHVPVVLVNKLLAKL